MSKEQSLSVLEGNKLIAEFMDTSVNWFTNIPVEKRNTLSDKYFPEYAEDGTDLSDDEILIIYKAEHPPLPTTVEMDLYPDNEAGAFDYLDNQVEDKDDELRMAYQSADMQDWENKTGSYAPEKVEDKEVDLEGENKRLKESNTVLLEALKKLYESIDSCIELTPNLMNKAKAAIEQANNSLTNKQG